MTDDAIVSHLACFLYYVYYSNAFHYNICFTPYAITVIALAVQMPSPSWRLQVHLSPRDDHFNREKKEEDRCT